MAHRYIGRNIYELRKKRGWSQSDLARKLDKKASTISSYETDSKTPSVDTIIAMSELFGVSIDELIYGENAEVLSTKHLAAEQKRAVADLLQGLTLYNDGNDKDGLARTRLLLQVIKQWGCKKAGVKIFKQGCTRLRAALLFWAKLVFCCMEPLKYCRNVADVKTLWYGEVVSKNRYPHLRIRHRRADAEHIRPETNPIPVSFRMEEYIMKKLSKRFLTLAIACVMAMAMAVPTFAAAPKRAAYAGVTYTILSKSNGLYASAQDGTNVQLASYAQKWTPVNDGGTIKLFRGTGNASKRVATYDKGEVILQASTCDYQVASIDFRTVSGQVHRIIFDQRNAYWNAIGTNIKTSWYNESSQAQLWTVNPA